MTKVFVRDIKERELLESPFLVRDKIMAMAKNGKPYMTLKLVDATGEVEGRVWDRVDEFDARFGKDDFILVRGKGSVYLGKMQLVVQDLNRLEEDEVDLADFLPVAERSSDEMVADLRKKVASLQDVNLKGLLEAFIDDPAFLKSYSVAPAAKGMHHVYLGGLLEHSLAVADLADDVSARYPGINRDLLITGALLHDIGKVHELKYARTFDYTDEGKLLGHIVIGVEMVEEKIRTLPEFPRELSMLVKHLLLSHHGQYDYGSPKRPKTLEAIVLNFVDDMDAKINGVQSHMAREPDRGGNWTNYHRLYDRYFYKGAGEQDEVSPVPREAAPPVAAPTPLKSSTPAKTSAPKRGGEGKKKFGTSLGEQLKGKNLDLF